MSIKGYSIILADPPWKYGNWSNKELSERGEKWAKKNGRSSYGVMDNEDICKLPIEKISAKNCILFLWATYPKLQEALEVIKRWGFQYKTVAFTWVKKNRVADTFYFGLGYWTRGNPEICLLATKGKISRCSNMVANLTIEHIKGHSEKPAVVREKIVRLMGDLPRIELFARKKVEGWDAVGYDIDGLDIAESIKLIVNGE